VYKHILDMVLKSFPFFEALPGVLGESYPTKTRATKDISTYLRAAKKVAKLFMNLHMVNQVQTRQYQRRIEDTRCQT